jgi:signal transduction histidine kinase
MPHVQVQWRLNIARFALSARSRSVLIGFSGLLLLTGLLALDSVRQLNSVALTNASLRKATRNRDAILDDLRIDFFRSATMVRDYLLVVDDVRAASLKSDLQLLRASNETTVGRYQTLVPANEKGEVENLMRHIQSYWNSLSPALEWNRSARQNMAESFLRNTIVPGRNELVQLLKQVNALDDHNLDSADARIEAVQSRFRRRVTTISLLTLALGAILAVVVLRNVRRLETAAEVRLTEALEARQQLRLLSDRLVKAQEDERRRLSRELHDELGQAMSAMLMELGRFESGLAVSGVQRERLVSVRRMAEDNVAMVRSMALLLRPSMLDELGLVPALKWQAREVTRRTGLKVKMIADELSDNLSDSYRTCIYRVVQEALNNCVKHSRATEVRVVIRREPDGLSVCVQDNGVGFDPASDKGLGLLGMAERVSYLGGRFHIKSQRGEGTILSAFLSLENRAHTPLQAGAA